MDNIKDSLRLFISMINSCFYKLTLAVIECLFSGYWLDLFGLWL